MIPYKAGSEPERGMKRRPVGNKQPSIDNAYVAQGCEKFPELANDDELTARIDAVCVPGSGLSDILKELQRRSRIPVEARKLEYLNPEEKTNGMTPEQVIAGLPTGNAGNSGRFSLENIEAVARETDETVLISETDLEAARRIDIAAAAVIRHWNEFGPKNGFEEAIDRLDRARSHGG